MKNLSLPSGVGFPRTGFIFFIFNSIVNVLLNSGSIKQEDYGRDYLRGRDKQ